MLTLILSFFIMLLPHHTNARFDKPAEYPERVLVPDAEVSWDQECRGYNPPYYVSPVVLQNDQSIVPGGWADPEPLVKSFYESFESPIHLDHRGRPLNPKGRTGLCGRGLLGKWGANFAADPIVTRLNPESGVLELLVILRKDCEEWALPGGMVDRGELITATLKRELSEETGANLDFTSAKMIYQGYVDDRRNTDNAWIETSAYHIHLSSEKPITLQAGDDAASVKWLPITEETLDHLYANHGDFVRQALN